MLPLKRILCPTDFSEPSYAALNAAIEFAQYFRAELNWLHVVAPVPIIATPAEAAGVGGPAVPSSDLGGEMLRGAQTMIAEAAHDRIPSAVDLHLLVRRGDPAHEILAAAADLEADAIIIATHGRTGWRRLLFGSVAETVFRGAACPVLTIRAPRDAAAEGDEPDRLSERA
jgi:nucleotide-binding universal stress UspA family protein